MERQLYESEARWKIYDTPSEQEMERKRAIQSLMPENAGSILDVGAGTGLMTNDVGNRFIVQLDFSLTALKRAMQNRILGDATHLPILSGKFHTIVATEILEHLDDQSFERCMSEIARMNATWVILSTPYKENLSTRLARCDKCNATFHVYNHKRSLSPSDLDALLGGYQRDTLLTLIETREKSAIVSRIGHAFGIYEYQDNLKCPNCGAPILPLTGSRKAMYRLFLALNFLITRLTRKKSKYIMALRYQKNDSP